MPCWKSGLRAASNVSVLRRIPQKLKCDVSAHIKRVLEHCVLFKLHGSLTMIFMGSQDV